MYFAAANAVCMIRAFLAAVAGGEPARVLKERDADLVFSIGPALPVTTNLARIQLHAL